MECPHQMKVTEELPLEDLLHAPPPLWTPSRGDHHEALETEHELQEPVGCSTGPQLVPWTGVIMRKPSGRTLCTPSTTSLGLTWELNRMH